MASDAVNCKKREKSGSVFLELYCILVYYKLSSPFSSWDYLNQQKLSEKAEGARGKRESPRQLVVKGNPDNC